MGNELNSIPTTGGVVMDVAIHTRVYNKFILVAILRDQARVSFRISNRTVLTVRGFVQRGISKKSPGRERKTRPGIHAYPDIAISPSGAQGSLAFFPSTRVSLISLMVKSVFGTLAYLGYLQVTSQRISYLKSFFYPH